MLNVTAVAVDACCYWLSNPKLSSLLLRLSSVVSNSPWRVNVSADPQASDRKWFRIPILGFGRYLLNFVSVLRYVFTHHVLGLVCVLPFICLLFSNHTNLNYVNRLHGEFRYKSNTTHWLRITRQQVWLYSVYYIKHQITFSSSSLDINISQNIAHSIIRLYDRHRRTHTDILILTPTLTSTSRLRWRDLT